MQERIAEGQVVGENRKEYFEAVEKLGLYSSPRNLQFYFSHIFEDANSFAGKSVLDVGAGKGLCGTYAACSGASKVIAIEPEAAGATKGVRSKFTMLLDELGLDAVSVLPVVFQEFDAGEEQFDIIILDDCVNHLDEEACVRLHVDQTARDTYMKIFTKLYTTASPGAKLVITDASRYNFFAMLGLKNPFTPTIDFEGHQSPKLWAQLLTEAGFQNPRIRWRSFNRFGAIGKSLFANKTVSFFLHSRFCLTMEKAQE